MLRLLHQLASATSAAEALARTAPPAVPTLMAAMDWGMAGSALALETLQRALSLANRARDNLVGSALGAGLVQILLKRLDWRSDAAADADNQVSCSSASSNCHRLLCFQLVSRRHLIRAGGASLKAVLHQSRLLSCGCSNSHLASELVITSACACQSPVFVG